MNTVEVNPTTAADQRDADLMLATMQGTKRERTIGKWNVTVNHDLARPGYGYFEHNVLGEDGGTGGLWFEGRRLVDYDGVFELPSTVKSILADLGYILDEFTR